jgi:spore coat protein SA
VVAVPSLSFDSFPTVNLEAFACKKPVVATCFGGSRELVEDGISGYIVNPFDVPNLAQKLAELLADDTKQKAFGEAGFKRVSQDFTLDKQMKKYESLIQSLKSHD